MKQIFQGQPDLHGLRIILLALLIDSFTIPIIDESYSGLLHWLGIAFCLIAASNNIPLGILICQGRRLIHFSVCSHHKLCSDIKKIELKTPSYTYERNIDHNQGSIGCPNHFHRLKGPLRFYKVQ